MYISYNIGGEKRECCYSNFNETITIYGPTGEEGEFKIVDNGNGDLYFEVDGEVIMLNDFICPTPHEFVANMQKYNDHALCQVLMKYGIDSIRVMVRKKKRERVNFGHGLILSFDTYCPHDKIEDCDWVEHRFVSEYLCRPEECHKLKLVPVDEELKEIYGYECTYASDLKSLMTKRTDLYQVKVNPNINV